MQKTVLAMHLKKFLASLSVLAEKWLKKSHPTSLQTDVYGRSAMGFEPGTYGVSPHVSSLTT